MNANDPDWSWIDQATMPRPLAIAIVLIVIGCVAVATDALSQTPAAPKGVQFDCAQLGRSIAGVATLRDLDASLDKTLTLVRAKNTATPRPQLEAIEREIRRMWRERLAPEEVGFAVYRRCQAQLGDMGREG